MVVPIHKLGVPPYPVRKLSLPEYHQMMEGGILRSGDPFEFIEGWLVPKMSRRPPHDLCLSLINKLLSRLLNEDWFCRVQSAITLADSEPEPDVAIVKGPERRYAHTHPGAHEIGLVVEISDASLAYDRGSKQRIYAKAGIAEYWIVNLVDYKVEVYTSPSGETDEPAYAQMREYRRGDSISVVLDGTAIGTVAATELLP